MEGLLGPIGLYWSAQACLGRLFWNIGLLSSLRTRWPSKRVNGPWCLRLMGLQSDKAQLGLIRACLVLI